MTSEMDLLRMDERQRLAWLMANRGTVAAVLLVLALVLPLYSVVASAPAR